MGEELTHSAHLSMPPARQMPAGYVQTPLCVDQLPCWLGSAELELCCVFLWAQAQLWRSWLCDIGVSGFTVLSSGFLICNTSFVVTPSFRMLAVGQVRWPSGGA